MENGEEGEDGWWAKCRILLRMRHEESPNQGHAGVVNEEERKNMRSVREIDLNMGGEQKEGSVKTLGILTWETR